MAAELAYDEPAQAIQAAQIIERLNENQREARLAILKAVNSDNPESFFLTGLGDVEKLTPTRCSVPSYVPGQNRPSSGVNWCCRQTTPRRTHFSLALLHSSPHARRQYLQRHQVLLHCRFASRNCFDHLKRDQLSTPLLLRSS